MTTLGYHRITHLFPFDYVLVTSSGVYGDQPILVKMVWKTQEEGPEAILCKALTALGKPADVTQLLGTYHFLASDASQYITGTDIRVDGGWIGGVTNKLADVLLS